MKPLCVDLYSGLHGFSEPFVQEGYRVKAYDLFDMHRELGLEYERPPEIELFLRDVREISGSEFADAACIVASPPCQKYSYMAMPWSRAKKLAAWYRQSQERIDQLNELFDACFRIQREASEAAGRYIPLIVENVKGAQPWVGRAAWHFGSFYLWGDVPALMPINLKRRMKSNGGTHDRTEGLGRPRFIREEMHMPNGMRLPESGANNGSGAGERALSDSQLLSEVGRELPGTSGRDSEGLKVPGQNWSRFKETGEVSPHWTMEGQKVGVYSDPRRNGGKGSHLTNPAENIERLHADRDTEGTKQHGSGPIWWRTGNGALPSKSSHRRLASAQIARIPEPLARHIAKCFYPAEVLA